MVTLTLGLIPRFEGRKLGPAFTVSWTVSLAKYAKKQGHSSSQVFCFFYLFIFFVKKQEDSAQIPLSFNLSFRYWVTQIAKQNLARIYSSDYELAGVDYHSLQLYYAWT